jgi:hypothetical protein
MKPTRNSGFYPYFKGSIMHIPYDRIICEVLIQHRNFLETGNMEISKEDLIETNNTNKLKNLTQNQKKICDTLIDIEACFS